ncbi:RNA-directed DNA polymerase [Sphingomonas sp. CFBP 13733]|uniref:RNA-directed DNA polymerase n=1 Tax=Sphingomonas sp. CFBP 13733 TaxID=2775291 RepID=UPI00177D95F0|nr:RNA-directed DNA polymerase [Sphingomonas sp. CFBP 13733]MBD8638953.1 RNA-directed DNA polymerase [Sphingomonas sp. CFBP 13733]
MLEAHSAARAILHLAAMGDTDIFPPPFEFTFYAEESEKISTRIGLIDAASYKPKSCFEALTPKSALSFRIAHQLYPADTLLYTAAVIQIAPSIEAIRLPSTEGPFSYRFIDDATNPKLFSDSSSFHDWLSYQRDTLHDPNPFSDVKYVIETDISDFYARVYFHRIEHVLDDCGASNSVRKIIEGIIKFSRARQSHGLPVGTSASRLLAEGLLNDTDRMISARSEKYTRYVDDFRIVLNHQNEVHSTLCRLAEHLMLTEGLSLNASKTKTYTSDLAHGIIDKKLSDIFNDDELVALSQYI